MKSLIAILVGIICCGLLNAAPSKPTPSDVFTAIFVWAESTPMIEDSFFVYANGNVSTRTDYFTNPGDVSTTYWQFYEENKEYVAEYQPYSCHARVYQEKYQSFWTALASATYIGQKTIQKTPCDYWESESETTTLSYCFENGTLPVYFKQTWRNGDPSSFYINNFVATVDPNAFKVPCA